MKVWLQLYCKCAEMQIMKIICLLFVYYHQDTHRHKEPTYGCSHITKKAIDKMHEHMHKTENRGCSVGIQSANVAAQSTGVRQSLTPK